jgi:F-type H+-transporting ATPase subunit a
MLAIVANQRVEPRFVYNVSRSLMLDLLYFDPLEQFDVLSITPFLGVCTITNIAAILAVNVITLAVYFNLYRVNIATNYDFVLSTLYNLVRSVVRENLYVRKQRYFNVILYLFLMLLFANIVGMIPYSFTVTSSFVVTFFIALGHFIGINCIATAQHG